MFATHILRGAIDAAGDLLFPPHCAACETAVDSGQWLCGNCADRVGRITAPRCANCSHPIAGESGPFTCPNCKDQEFSFEFAVAVVRATGTTRELIHRLKYKRDQRLAQFLGLWLTEGFHDSRMDGFNPDAIVPVPLHPVRKREREFNQSELLARVASRKLGIPVLNALARRRYTETQTHFDREHRMQNLRDAIFLSKNTNVQNLNIVIVDDVLTTGSTLDECARVLIAAGAGRVCAVTVARG